jgi:hypothetical protein
LNILRIELFVPTAKYEPELENLHVLMALLSGITASLVICLGFYTSPVKL